MISNDENNSLYSRPSSGLPNPTLVNYTSIDWALSSETIPGVLKGFPQETVHLIGARAVWIRGVRQPANSHALILDALHSDNRCTLKRDFLIHFVKEILCKSVHDI